MSRNAIVVENLSKYYLIGHRLAPGETALRDVITREVRNFLRKAGDVARGRQIVRGDEIEEFWALKDVTFQVKQGEVVGVIGRNGAGKSTLLKILSRITEPTKGRALLSGRVSSLLEVGTGFHPELTGRENIFLNGAILGMTQREIRRKFDEIVGFAGIEKFLDTPVKRYSSGMYVRLAFAVAAHLEPEILLIDEVLAVGDADFQRKSLGKMDEVSRRHGRTVLFVSHNLEAVLRLCTRSILLDVGSVVAAGDTKAVVAAYLDVQSPPSRVVDLSSMVRPPDWRCKVRLATVSPSDPESTWSIPFGRMFSLNLSLDAESSTRIDVLVAIASARGFDLASWANTFDNIQLSTRPGINTLRVAFDRLLLLPGQYSLGIGLRDDRGAYDWLPEALQFRITASPEVAEIKAEAFPAGMAMSASVSSLD